MTIVIAHRGSSYLYPEHTRVAYDDAVAAQVDGFECDVRLLRDGEIICWHDATLNRTSNSSGLIFTRTWQDMQGIDAGSWHRSKKPQPPLRFIELLALAQIHRKSISIETKHPVPNGGAIEHKLAALLPAVDFHGSAALAPFRLMSFSLLAVQRWSTLRPDIPAVYLLDHRLLSPLPKVPVIGPGMERLRRDPEIVARLHEQGYEVHVWTVDEERDVELCVKLGVEAIISNRPREVRALLGEIN